MVPPSLATIPWSPPGGNGITKVSVCLGSSTKTLTFDPRNLRGFGYLRGCTQATRSTALREVNSRKKVHSSQQDKVVIKLLRTFAFSILEAHKPKSKDPLNINETSSPIRRVRSSEVKLKDFYLFAGFLVFCTLPTKTEFQGKTSWLSIWQIWYIYFDELPDQNCSLSAWM